MKNKLEMILRVIQALMGEGHIKVTDEEAIRLQVELGSRDDIAQPGDVVHALREKYEEGFGVDPFLKRNNLAGGQQSSRSRSGISWLEPSSAATATSALMEEGWDPDNDPTCSMSKVGSNAYPDLSMPKSIGPYEVIKRLGHGGFGAVYKVRHIETGIIYAVKVLLPEVGEYETARARFRTEALATLTFHHPNLVRGYCMGDAGGCQYLVMQFIDGKDLAKAFPPLSSGEGNFETTLKAVIQACRGVGVMHEGNVIHRDIKPDNLIVCADTGIVIVVDGGLLKKLEGSDLHVSSSGAAPAMYDSEGGDGSSDGELIGTPNFMAPEQTSTDTDRLTMPSDIVDKPTDVYQLGATAFYVLTGELLHTGNTPLGILAAKRREKGIPKGLKRGLKAGVPKGYSWRRLFKVLGKSLHRDPSQRQKDANELADDLERYLEEHYARLANRARAKTVVLLMSCLVMGIVAILKNVERNAEAKLARQAELRAIDQEKANREKDARIEAEEKARFETEHQNAILAKVDGAKRSAGNAKRVANWGKARDDLEACLKLLPGLFEERRDLAEAMFILEDPKCIQHYLWLSEYKGEEASELGNERSEHRLMAMLATLDFSKASAAEKQKAMQGMMVQGGKPFFTAEAYLAASTILLQASKVDQLREAGKSSEAKEVEKELSSFLITLYAKEWDTALPNYVLAVYLQEYHPKFRARSIELLGVAYSKNEYLLLALMKRQEYCLAEVEEPGVGGGVAITRISQAYEALLTLREKMHGHQTIDAAFIRSAIMMSRLRDLRHRQKNLVDRAFSVAEGYQQLQRTNPHLHKGYDLELSCALAFAAKYERAKAKNLADKDKNEFKAVALEALQRAHNLSPSGKSLNEQRYAEKAKSWIREMLR